MWLKLVTHFSILFWLLSVFIYCVAPIICTVRWKTLNCSEGTVQWCWSGYDYWKKLWHWGFTSTSVKEQSSIPILFKHYVSQGYEVTNQMNWKVSSFSSFIICQLLQEGDSYLWYICCLFAYSSVSVFRGLVAEFEDGYLELW